MSKISHFKILVLEDDRSISLMCFRGIIYTWTCICAQTNLIRHIQTLRTVRVMFIQICKQFSIAFGWKSRSYRYLSNIFKYNVGIHSLEQGSFYIETIIPWSHFLCLNILLLLFLSICSHVMAMNQTVRRRFWAVPWRFSPKELSNWPGLSLSSVRVKGAWLQDTGCSLSYSKTLSTLHYQRWGIILKTQLANKVCYSKHDAFISSSVSLSRSCRVYTCTKIKQVQADLY